MNLNNGFTWVTNTRVKPDTWIVCQGYGCGRPILFCKSEILIAREIGKPTSTPCRFCKYHPTFPPEPWNPITDDGKLKMLGYNGQWEKK